MGHRAKTQIGLKMCEYMCFSLYSNALYDCSINIYTTLVLFASSLSSSKGSHDSSVSTNEEQRKVGSHFGV